MVQPLVQGKLRDEILSATVYSQCHHCGEEMEINCDSSMNIEVVKGGRDALVNLPFYNFLNTHVEFL